MNVADQRRDPESLLNWMERLIRVTKECPELQWGRWRALDVGAPAVVAQLVDWDGAQVVTLHNLSAEPVTVTLDFDADAELQEVFGARDQPPVDAAAGRIPLDRYGYRWFRAEAPPGAAPSTSRISPSPS